METVKTSLKSYWDLLSRHIRPQRSAFTLLAVLLLGNIGLQIANPQIMRTFIDAALAGEAQQRLVIAGLAFIGIALLQQVVSIFITYLGQNVAWTATNALRADLAQHCLTLDMSFHNAHTPGEMIERIDGDVAELSIFFSQFVIMLAGNALMLVGILTVLFFEDWRAGLAFAAFAMIALAVLFRLRDAAVPSQKARRQAEADLFGFVEEQLNATEDIRSNGAVDFSLRELFRYQAQILRHLRRSDWIHTWIGILMGGLLIAGNAMAIGTGYWLYITGSITIGTVYLLINYVNLLEGPIWALTHQTQSFQTIGACVARLTELRKVQNKVLDGPGAEIPAGPLALAFENVSFKYHNGTNHNGGNPNGGNPNGGNPNGGNHRENGHVLQDIAFKLNPGKTLGLLGRTGSGKTTLARLIFRLYDPTAGQIRLGGVSLREAKAVDLRQHVAFVTQDVQLFQASVRDNLTFFDRSIPDERILYVLEELGLADWLAGLPAGLDTELEKHSLSAGEAQLLALTRVFLRDPGLVILDEASSRLDPATEQRMEWAIERLLQDRTAIIIAHRLGTVQRTDEILILEDGMTCEHGNRLDLAADPNSRFYQLLQTGLEEVLV
jgi:ABC-type multidrug transport system fused ATPase/permease subunit